MGTRCGQAQGGYTVKRVSLLLLLLVVCLGAGACQSAPVSPIDTPTPGPTPTPTPPPLLNGDFELGPANWTEFSSNGALLILQNPAFPPGVTARSGTWAVWLGGIVDEVSYIQQQVNVNSI